MPNTTGRQTLQLWSLREDVLVEMDEGSGGLGLTGRWGTERIDRPDPIIREALRRMELGPVLLANVRGSPSEADNGTGDRSCGEPPNDEADTYRVLLPVLNRLSHYVVRTLALDDLRGPLLSVSPVARHASFTPVRLPARRRIWMPRGVSLRLEETSVVLESSDSPYRVVLHRPEALWIVSMLAWPITPDAAAAALPLPPEVTESTLGYLAAAGMTAPVETAQIRPQ